MLNSRSQIPSVSPSRKVTEENNYLVCKVYWCTPGRKVSGPRGRGDYFFPTRRKKRMMRDAIEARDRRPETGSWFCRGLSREQNKQATGLHPMFFLEGQVLQTSSSHMHGVVDTRGNEKHCARWEARNITPCAVQGITRIGRISVVRVSARSSTSFVSASPEAS